MDKEELFEEIRSLLLEPQVDSVDEPWVYDDSELVRQVRSAIRSIKAVGVTTDAVMAKDGTLDPIPADNVGLLIAYSVAAKLLRGDLVRKLADGEMGVQFRAGRDVIDTKTAGRYFTDKASEYMSEYEVLLGIMLTDSEDAAQNLYGEPFTSFGDLS